MAEFLTTLDARCIEDKQWLLLNTLSYFSDVVGKVDARKGFKTDFASIPRWIPFVSAWLVGRAHYEATIHDWLYKTDSIPQVTRSQADSVLLEAMKVRGKPRVMRWTIYTGVRLGGWTAWHTRKVADQG
jgi:hypothetical protein